MNVLKDVLQELKKLNPKCRNLAKQIELAKTGEKLLVARSLDIQDKEEETLIQKIVDLLERPSFSGSAEEKVRMNMAAEQAKGIDITTREQEDAWESKLQKARKKDQKRIQAEKKRRMESIDSKEANTLAGLKGLGSKSIRKLIDAGIRTTQEFMALSHEQRVDVVGALVADKFKPA